MRQSNWPIPGCSSNTIRGRSEGQWRIGEATAILIMLFANVAYHIMHTTLSFTQSESARFYSVFSLDNIYSPHYKVNLHSYPIRLLSYQTLKKSSSLVQLVTMLCHVIKTHRMVGKGSAHWHEENLQKRKFNSAIADLW